MTSLVDRRKRELSLKLKSLEDELAAWERRTADAPMRRHFSQVRRIKEMLAGLLGSMTNSTGWKTPTEELVLSKSAAWERRILTAHAIWEFFRSKLGQRDDALFRDRLMACDDLAWACYEPAMLQFSTMKREPTLVYLNSTWSAFLRRRGTSFEKDIEAGRDARDALDEADYRATLKRLPIPLLGLPWFQIAHLPSSLLVAHEVGHAVEFDFGLTPTIDAALVGAGLTSAPDWQGAASEVFADLYGCLCLGEYFASALLDLLVADRAIAAETAFGAYPARAYRVELTAKALEFLNLGDAAVRVRQTWESAYGSLASLLTRGDDADKVVAAIYGPTGLNLAAVIRPPTANIAALAQVASLGDTQKTQGDARALFCALRHVYENGPASQFAAAGELIVAQVVNKYAGVFRFRGASIATQRDAEQQVDALAASDRAAGKELATTLRLDDEDDEEPASG